MTIFGKIAIGIAIPRVAHFVSCSCMILETLAACKHVSEIGINNGSKLNWKQASDNWSLHSKGRGDLKFQANEWQLASLWQREGRLQCDLKRRSNCWILVSTRNWREVKLLKQAQLQASKRLCSLHSKGRGDYYLKQATVGVSTAKWGESIEESSIASK